MATPAQLKLFSLMADFSTDTVTGWLSSFYLHYGWKAAGSDEFPRQILKFAEEYFNNCARWIYNRKDEYINAKFDEMLSVLQNKYDPIDLLNIIVMLCLHALNNIDVSPVMSENRESSMSAAKVHIHAIINRKKELAQHLHGCTPDHIHTPVGENERVFSFSMNKYVQTEQGEVKLTELK
ncbi:Hypothetical protein PACV_444 [Pacmanvirus A23]|uniref:Hypothetical protein n=1 Tax=Pacmanvirus A23 TaxID=1932881 RepID=UPI000A0952C4|nr:Hypothetical protein B9W72_gp440 [Pacmanvirus A23]SIP86157.1 Hypothetical protein PACV_444 [Pacmanvirus A23]